MCWEICCGDRCELSEKRTHPIHRPKCIPWTFGENIYSVSFSTTLFPQLQLWHLQWLASVQSAYELLTQVPLVLYCLFHGDAAATLKTHWCLDDVDHDNDVLIPVYNYQLDRHRGLRSWLSIRRVFIHVHSNTSQPCGALWVLSVPKPTPCCRGNTAEMFNPFDGKVHHKSYMFRHTFRATHSTRF